MTPIRQSLCCTLFALALVVGCGTPSDSSMAVESNTAENGSIEGTSVAALPDQTIKPASFRTGTAKEFLHAVFVRYQTATSYHDRGRVRLTTSEDGKRVERTAPMSMWLERTDVDLVAYDVRITIEESILQAWVVDPASDNLDSQVLHVPLPLRRGRPSLAAALSDPILASRLGSGLAGPPPQLEWLFAPEPMPGLFRGDHEFQFLADQRIDERLCRCIRVIVLDDQTPSEYRFYVDAENDLVRQVDLPSVSIPDAQGHPRQAAISIELSSASFAPPSRRRLRNGFPKSPIQVKRFVPVPLPPPSESSRVPSELRQAWDEQVKQYRAAIDAARL
jgi:hypothetical protein